MDYSAQAVVATYCENLGNIKRRGATISLQCDLASVMYPLPDVRGASSGYWVFTNEHDILRTQPTMGGW